MVRISPHLETTCNLRGTILQRKVCEKALDLTEPYQMIDYTYSNSRLSEIDTGNLKIKNASDKNIACTLTCVPFNFGIRIPNDMFRVPTPCECWRLMGFSDDDHRRAAQVCDEKHLYQQAGNSIVVNVLMAIFKELLMPEKSRSEWLDELLNF